MITFFGWRRTHLRTNFAILVALTTALSRFAVWAQSPTQWQQMDFGPTFSSTFDARYASTRNPTYKGIAVRLRRDGKATALFDTDLLRYSAWWNGGFIQLPEKSRDGLGDAVAAAPVGTVRLGTPNVPGWSHDKTFNDPRTQPWGPLPREHSKYRGLYLHGDRTVLSYTVGETPVLDSPWAESVSGDNGAGEFEAFARTIEIDAHSETLSLLVCERKDSTARIAAGNGVEAWEHGDNATAVALAPASKSAAKIHATSGQFILEIPPAKQSRRLKLLLWSGAKADLKEFVRLVRSSPAPHDLRNLTQGGPRRWAKPQITHGVLGKEPGPYAVDTLTAPYENSWKSYLRFSGHDFFSNGDAAICSVSGDVWIVKGIDAGLEKLTWTRYATGLHEPLGLKIVNDQIYVLGRGQITRLRDLNKDGEADFYENFNNDAHYFGHGHAFYTELHTDKEGNFYFTVCADPDERPGQHGGCLIRVSADGQRLERVATGFRNPNGMTVSRDGRVVVADQQGGWVPSSRIDWVRPGGFYGYMPMHHRETPPTIYDNPILWLPHNVDNSSGGQAWIEDDRWGPLKGKLVHLSYGACRMFIILPEIVAGQIQGAAVPLPVRFSTGVMRARFHPGDGQLYVSGLRGWQTAGTLSGAFYRVRYTGRPLSLPVSFHVRTNGLLVNFSERLDPKLAADTGSYDVSQWNYRWTKEYGSPHYSVAHPEAKGEDDVEVSRIEAGADGRSVLLHTTALGPVMQMRIRYNLATAEGTPLSGEIYNTINVLPATASESSEWSGSTPLP